MKELNRTKRLVIATILFVVIILIGFLTFEFPEFEYAISTDSMIEELNNPNNLMTPEEAVEIIANQNSSYIFIDLRNPFEFNKGYFGEAINIPVSDILDKENISFFQQMQNDSIVVVLYSNNQREANGQWMLLRQLGFYNMKVLLGGYNYLVVKKNNPSDLPLIQLYHVEAAALDFAAYFEEEGSGGDKSKENHPDKTVEVQPVKRKKKNISAGGC
ncbi:MAG: rhodanese-like domain-containing protein [Bacteroidales bacterium]